MVPACITSGFRFPWLASLAITIPFMKKLSTSSGLVYSTDTGRMCPGCRQPVAACTCKQAQAIPSAGGPVRVSRESKGRGGKTVTVIKGLPLEALALAQLGKQIKAACGSGGTVKDGVIEVQGDHCELVVQMLQKLGHAAKRAGG
jgi:translation initiation factor 1